MLKILFMLMQIFGKYILIVEMSSLNFLISIEAMLIVTYLLIFRKFLQSLYLLRK